MKTLVICPLLLLVATAGMPARADQAAAIPANVMAALTRKFPHAAIDRWTKEKEGGKQVYDIEFHQGNQKFEADIFADGTIHNWEQQIARTDLPEPVLNAVNRKFPRAVLKEVMAVTDVQDGREQLTGYEVVIQRAHKKDVEMTIAPDGKVLEGPGAEK